MEREKGMEEVVRWCNRTWNFPRLMHRLAGYSVPPGDSVTLGAILGILGVLGSSPMLW